MEYAWSSKDTRSIKKAKDLLADQGYETESVRIFVKTYYQPEKYASLLENKNPLFLVMPSTRGDNAIPLGIAEMLQSSFGGEIVKGFAGAMHETKSANLGAIGKIKEPRLYEIYPQCRKTLSLRAGI